MYKVYQLQRVNEVRTNGKRSYDVKMNIIGEYSEIKENKDPYFLADSVWDACNVSCWDSEWVSPKAVVKDDITFYPTNDFQGYCNSDVVIETKDGLYLAKSFGFVKVPDLDEAIYRIINSFGFISWDEIRDKSALDENELKRVGEIMQKEYDAESSECSDDFLEVYKK